MIKFCRTQIHALNVLLIKCIDMSPSKSLDKFAETSKCQQLFKKKKKQEEEEEHMYFQRGLVPILHVNLLSG